MSTAKRAATSGQFVVQGPNYNIVHVEPKTRKGKTPSQERNALLYRALGGRTVVMGTDGLTEITNVTMTPEEVEAFDKGMNDTFEDVLKDLKRKKR